MIHVWGVPKLLILERGLVVEGPGKHQELKQPGKGSTVAERLDYLAKLRPEDKGGEWSDAEISRGIERRQLGSLSTQTIWRLRTGRADDPKFSTLVILAEFFGVERSYFTDEDPTESLAQIRYLLARRDGGMRETLARLGELSDDHLGVVGNVIDQLLALEQKHSQADPGNVGADGENSA
ncbi:hypothetical protein BS329_15435 [Amycolatopsis coloradensis]|uniref:HTH cro/C1-type domain-containing protein n=1 Tax=Amycolatopsis coloradensis TaxID=76021 RepID=A0A1R0KU41_9PSEU|nr:hypothetical protein [Amycolatopsis coloradensis]OLZ51657.1 hypothetical protein BS329_15435 [Amycolatopsis coloradensis]